MERQRMLVAFAKWFLPLTGITILTFLSLSVLQGHLGGRDLLNVHTNPDESVERHATNRVKFSVKDENIAYLGKRPHERTIAHHANILAACNGTGYEGWRDTRNCIDYLRDQEQDYYSIDNSAETVCDPKDPVKYHTYWRGPFTWRVSFMLKSFLFTQNLKCSRMYIWLDADYGEDILRKNSESRLFRPFKQLEELGIIVLREWKYPDKVYIPPEYQSDELDAENNLIFQDHLIPRGAVAVSDSVRFILLHLEGGFYIDMDTMFLRDLRPLLLTPGLSFAERWAAHRGLGEYNTAYLRLEPFSSLSSRILQGGSHMGINFHPRVIGRMLAKTGHELELVRFETGLFDPLWSEFDKDRNGVCCTPCLTKYWHFFEPLPIKNEWSSLEQRDRNTPDINGGNLHQKWEHGFNRTLSTFYRGAYSHHIHNQWATKIKVYSWSWVADQSFNQFLRGERTNPYGESWTFNTLDFTSEEEDYLT